jgi:ParE toxin of type II toxin-antitoxin system, parDE
MHIRWTPAAAADLQHIANYLKQYHPHYREPTMRKLYDTIRSLKQSPHRSRPGTEGGTREILFPPLPLCRGLPRQGADHRSLTHLSHRAGSALRRNSPKGSFVQRDGIHRFSGIGRHGAKILRKPYRRIGA